MIRFPEESLTAALKLIYSKVKKDDELLNKIFKNDEYVDAFKATECKFFLGYNLESLSSSVNVMCCLLEDSENEEMHQIGYSFPSMDGDAVVFRNKVITLSCVSNNERETIIVAHFVKWACFYLLPALSKIGWMGVKITVEDVKIPELFERNEYMRGVTISFIEQESFPNMEDFSDAEMTSLNYSISSIFNKN